MRDREIEREGERKRGREIERERTDITCIRDRTHTRERRRDR